MATLSDVIRLIETGETPEFSPAPFFDEITDSFIYYAKDTRTVANRLNSRFTLFLDVADRSLVGFEIKSFKRLVKRIRQFDLFVTKTTVRLDQSIMMALGVEDIDSPIDDEDETIESITMFLRDSRLSNSAIDMESMELCEAD
ncbi:MAG: hypothetical protein KDB01_12240 [Planctomycetaceae bacterium]|nr:hypothetical protein [Planctomycetaceae bacterium]